MEFLKLKLPKMHEEEVPSQANSELQTQQLTLDESIVEEANIYVCRDVNMILTKNAIERAQDSETLQQLKEESLRYQIKIIEAQTLTKEIEKTLHKNQKEVQMLYESEEYKNYVKNSLRATATKMIDELDAQITIFRKNFKMVVARCERLSKKIKELEKQVTESEKLLTKAQEIEEKGVMYNLTFNVDRDIVEDNQSTIKMIEEKKSAMENKLLKKANKERLISHKLTLLEENYGFQKEVQQNKEKLKNEKAGFNDGTQKRNELQEELRAKMSNETQKRNSSLEKISSVSPTIKEIDQEIEELMQSATERQVELQRYQQQVKNRQQDANSTTKEVLNIEKVKKDATNKKQQIVENKKGELLMQKSDQAAISLSLNDMKVELMAEMLDDKTQLTHQESKFVVKLDQLKNFQMDLVDDELHVEKLGAIPINLLKTLEEVKRKQMQLSFDYQQLGNGQISKHIESLDAVSKEIRNREADIELYGASVNEISKECEGKKGKIKVMDEETMIRQNNIKLNQREKYMVKALEDSLKKYREKLEMYEKSTEQQKKNERQTMSENPIYLIEDEEKMENQTGRKSPGILKSPFKKPNVMHKKIVTFDVNFSSSSNNMSPELPESTKQKSAKIGLKQKAVAEKEDPDPDNKKKKIN